MTPYPRSINSDLISPHIPRFYTCFAAPAHKLPAPVSLRVQAPCLSLWVSPITSVPRDIDSRPSLVQPANLSISALRALETVSSILLNSFCPSSLEACREGQGKRYLARTRFAVFASGRLRVETGDGREWVISERLIFC